MIIQYSLWKCDLSPGTLLHSVLADCWEFILWLSRDKSARQGALLSLSWGSLQHPKLKLKVIYLLTLASFSLYKRVCPVLKVGMQYAARPAEAPQVEWKSHLCFAQATKRAQTKDVRCSRPRKELIPRFPFILSVKKCHGESKDGEVFHGGEEDSGQRGTFFSNILAA